MKQKIMFTLRHKTKQAERCV